MGTLAFDIEDLNKNLTQSTSRSLFCIAGELDFSFLVNDSDITANIAGDVALARRNRYFNKPLRDLPSILRDNPVLFGEFGTVVVGLRDIPCVFVNAGELHSKGAEHIINEHTAVSPNDTVMVDLVPGSALACIYSVPSVLLREIDLYFHHARIKHTATAQVCHLLNHLNRDETKMLVVWTRNHLQISLAVDGNFAFYNAYSAPSDKVVAYFIAAVAIRCNIDLQSIKLYFGGHRISGEKIDTIRGILKLAPSNDSGVANDEYYDLELNMLSQCG